MSKKTRMLSCVAIGDQSGKTRVTLDLRSRACFMINQGQSAVTLKVDEVDQLIEALTLFKLIKKGEDLLT